MVRKSGEEIGVKSASQFRETIGALAAITGAIGLRWFANPWLGGTTPFITVFAVLLILVVRVRPIPFVIAAVSGWVGCWLLFTPNIVAPPVSRSVVVIQFLIFAFSLLAACFAAWAADRTRQRTQAAMRQSEIQREALGITLASIGDAVITIDPLGSVMFLNATAENLTGWTSDQAIGKDSHEVFHIVNEETREPVENPAIKVLKTGKIVGLANHTILIKRDASEISIDDSAAPIRDSRGDMIGVVLVFRDISERRAAEQALHRSERDLSDFFENSTVGLHWVGPDGIIVRTNRAELEMLGYDAEEYIGHHVSDFHADSKAIEQILATLTQGEEIKECPARLIKKDGTIIDVLIDSSALFENGRFIHSRCFTRDITTHKKEEHARTLLAAIVETSDDAIVSLTLEGIILSWNKGAQNLYGYSAEQVIGQSINIIVPPELQEKEAEILEILGRGDHLEHYETTRLTKDRFRVPVSLSVSPIRNAVGDVIGVSKVARDITDRRRNEQYAMFLDGTSTSLAGLIDSDTLLNRVAWLAVPTFADWCSVDLVENESTLRRVSTAHIDPQKVALAHDLLERMPQDPNSNTGVWGIVHQGKSELVSDITTGMIEAAVTDEELLATLKQLDIRSYIGVPLKVREQVIGVITFISAESGRRFDAKDLQVAEDLANRVAISIENARLYEELRFADRRKDEFLATLAHELRNPLAPLRNSLEIIKQADDDIVAIRQARNFMSRQVDQIVHLVDDLLDVSRISRDKLGLRIGPTQLGAIIQQAMDTANALDHRGCENITVDIPNEPIRLQGDHVRLVQVFSNLLNNACKFTPQEGKIVISARRQGDFVEITVADDGIGISKDKITSIFEMFGQVDADQERTVGGLGIGLTLVKRLVELHGGSIRADSQGLGFGSTFTVRLPLDETQIEPSEKVPESESIPGDIQILVVDDNEDAAKTLSLLLGYMGNSVRTEHNGEAAISAIKEFAPSLMFLDIGLPDFDGCEVCRRIRQMENGKSVYIVALTGWGQEEDRKKSEDAGFDRHVVKPISPEDLTEILLRVKGNKIESTK
jgi:PAS domain S-box-containing protein